MDVLRSLPLAASSQRTQKFAGCAVLLLALTALGFLQHRPVTATPAIAGDILKQPIAIANFELTTDRGVRFTQANLTRRWTLLQFGFSSCPGICPVNLAVVSQLSHRLQDSVAEGLQPQLVFVSVDPARDTPKRLSEFADAIDPSVIAVTGVANQLRALEQSLATTHSYSDVGVDGFYMANHSASIYLIDPHGRWVATLRPPFHLDTLQKDYLAAINYATQHG